MEGSRGADRVSVGRREGKRHVGRPSFVEKDNIKKIGKEWG